MTDLPAHDYIDTADALADFCARIAKAPYIAIDTEFLRERTYRPELCLVQIKHEDALGCIDALALDDLGPLLAILNDPGIVKVLHAASQDLEIFWLASRKVPAPIFDTQVAAPLLGHGEQIGYGNLVRERLDIELAKSHTRADWTRRPLPPEQIAYALDDVIYLETLYLDMRAELEQSGRLAWLAPEFAVAENPATYDQPAGERWKRIRNVQRYKSATLAVIQALAEWRELTARQRNLPRNWLLKDDVILALAQQRPDSLDELGHVRGLDRKSRERHGQELIDLIATSQQRTPDPLPEFRKKKKLDAGLLARVQLLDAWVHQRGLELGIAPGLLAPPKLLERVVTGEGRSALTGWREPLLGDDLEALLDQRDSIGIDPDGGLRMIEGSRVV